MSTEIRRGLRCHVYRAKSRFVIRDPATVMKAFCFETA